MNQCSALTYNNKQAANALLFLLGSAMIMVACSSGKFVQRKTTAVPASAPENLCNRTVKYYIKQSLVTMNSGEEMEDHTAVEMTVNPSDGHLTINTAKESGNGRMELKLKSCNLTAGMQSGAAEYELIDKDHPTEIKRIKMLVEASGGDVAISLSELVQRGGMKSAVTRWELIE